MESKVAAPQPFVRAPAAGSTLNVLGVTHIYKATAAETGGSFSLWEAVFPPGKGAPPHTHGREDEAFYVLSGELVIELGDKPASHRLRGWLSSLVRAAGAMLSATSVMSRPVCLSSARPGCGLDQMFSELDEATARGMPDFATLTAICARYGVAIEPGQASKKVPDQDQKRT